MNTKLLLGLLVVVVVAVGGYMVINNKSASDAMTADDASMMQEENNETPKSQAFSGSIFDLASQGVEWECSVDATAQTGAGSAVSSGTVYVAGNMIRANFTSNIESFGTVNTYMIADDADVYSWSSMAPQGVKVPRADMEEGNVDSAETSGQMVDADHSYSYDCTPTSVDPSLFVAPSSVTFMEM